MTISYWPFTYSESWFMYTTLEHLEQHSNPQRPKNKIWNFFKEIRIILVFFVIVSASILVFTNADLFIWNLITAIQDQPLHQIQNIQKSDVYQDSDISSAIENNQNKIDEVQALIKKYQTWEIQTNSISLSLDSYLKTKLKDYPLKFNTLPPVNKLLIPSLWLDIPIIISPAKDIQDFSQWNFDLELNQWVVKYPTTPNPWEKWNTLIFGHTSQERWKHNPYGTIFKTLPNMKNGDWIQVIREWKLLEYKVIDKFIVQPKEVNAQYLSYQNAWWKYLTLMWCYPLWTDKNRIMVIAKIVE